MELVSALRGKKFVLADHTELLDDLDLTKKLTTRAQDLSGGQKRKLALALAFIGDTKILYLDEATSGVDSDSRKVFWKIIREYRTGRIIICASKYHLLNSRFV